VLGCTWSELAKTKVDSKLLEELAHTEPVRKELVAKIKERAGLTSACSTTTIYKKLGLGGSSRDKGVIEGWWLPSPDTLTRISKQLGSADTCTFLGPELHQRYMEAVNG
jgi:hypothetical protein